MVNVGKYAIHIDPPVPRKWVIRVSCRGVWKIERNFIHGAVSLSGACKIFVCQFCSKQSNFKTFGTRDDDDDDDDDDVDDDDDDGDDETKLATISHLATHDVQPT